MKTLSRAPSSAAVAIPLLRPFSSISLPVAQKLARTDRHSRYSIRHIRYVSPMDPGELLREARGTPRPQPTPPWRPVPARPSRRSRGSSRTASRPRSRRCGELLDLLGEELTLSSSRREIGHRSDPEPKPTWPQSLTARIDARSRICRLRPRSGGGKQSLARDLGGTWPRPISGPSSKLHPLLAGADSPRMSISSSSAASPAGSTDPPIRPSTSTSPTRGTRPTSSAWRPPCRDMRARWRGGPPDLPFQLDAQIARQRCQLHLRHRLSASSTCSAISADVSDYEALRARGEHRVLRAIRRSGSSRSTT